MKLLTVVPLTCGSAFTVTLAPVETVKVATKLERFVPFGNVTKTSFPFIIPDFKGVKTPNDKRSHAELFTDGATVTETKYDLVEPSSAVTT